MTYVVKVNSRKKNYTVYIGREWAGIPESKWSNPHHLYTPKRVNGEWVRVENDRQEIIRKYEAYVRSKPELMSAIPELIDQVLGCWCYPEACHGDVLVKLVKEYEDGKVQPHQNEI